MEANKTRCLVKRSGRGSIFLGNHPEEPQKPHQQIKFSFLDLKYHILKMIFDNLTFYDVTKMFAAHTWCENAAIDTLKSFLRNSPSHILRIHLNLADVNYVSVEHWYLILNRIASHVTNLEIAGYSSPYMKQKITDSDIEFIKCIPQICPNVRDLKLSYIVTNDINQSYFEEFKNLTTISLELARLSGPFIKLSNNITQFSTSILHDFDCKHCKNIRHYDSMSESNILEFCRANDNLKEIDISIKFMCKRCEVGRQFLFSKLFCMLHYEIRPKVETMVIRIEDTVVNLAQLYGN